MKVLDMTAFDKIAYENKILKLFGNKNKLTSKYLINKLTFIEMLHLIVFKGMFANFEIVNIDFDNKLEYEDNNLSALVPYFELIKVCNEKEN